MSVSTIDRPISALRQRMLDDMAMRGLRSDTQRDYIRVMRGFAPPPTEGKRRRVMLRRGWLFPGRSCTDPISVDFPHTRARSLMVSVTGPTCASYVRGRRGAPDGFGGNPSGLEHLISRRSLPGILHMWTRAGSRRFPGDPSYAFALLQDPGRAGKISPWLRRKPIRPGTLDQPAFPSRHVAHVDACGISQVSWRSILCLCPAPRPRPSRQDLALAI